MKEGYVLYVDHAQHPAPLTMCFHATGARRLSSAVADRYPPSTVTEVDSGFCPQCLSYHDASSAARLGFCSKPSCNRCPICQAVCSINLEGSLFFYSCGACDWTSKECNVVVQVEEEDGRNLGRMEFARALEDLGTLLKRQRAASGDDAWQQPWNKLSQAWEKRTQDAKPTSWSRRDLRLSRSNSNGPAGAWSVDSLEASMKQKMEALNGDFATKLQFPVQRVSLDDDSDGDKKLVVMDESMNGISHAAIQLQVLNRPDPIRSRSEMLPLPIPLRPRNSRRCRAELALGRPGILLKPKLNPLEGDSSLRSGHGQWFKKDSSAILVMPRVRIMNYDKTPERSAFLIKCTNPTLGRIRMRFAASHYKGEYDWDDPDNGPRQPILNQVLVDELRQEHLDLELNTTLLSDLATTETIELLSSEDSFIEFGGKAREIPAEVRDWTPSVSDEKVDKSTMRVVSASSSTAWFELITVGEMEAVTERKHLPAIPLAIEVEVGNGSWESSLIAQEKSDGDFVAFDLVLACP